MEGPGRILVVDDDGMNRELLEALLLPMGYDVLSAKNGFEALAICEAEPPDLVLLDIMMPEMDGFETALRLKQNEKTRTIPIVMVTALSQVEHRVRALDAGADDFLHKPIEQAELKARVRSLLQVKAYHDHLRAHQSELERQVKERTAELVKALAAIKGASLETILRLSRAAEYKDGETYAHICRVSEYAAVLAKRMNLKNGDIENILYATPMHDIGKIGIPDAILLKPDSLNVHEARLMQQHTVLGGKILENSDSELIRMAETIALTHHEKWDGSGYPMGLKEQAIPLPGRIAALADVFDALTSARPYKKAISWDESIRMVNAERATHFDPDVVEAFESAQGELKSIHDRYRDHPDEVFMAPQTLIRKPGDP